MTLSDLLTILKANDAVIVHCARSNRAGEIYPKPIYPDDLKQTTTDLAAGNVRTVSCSVVWPAHQHSFGEVGIVIRPRNVGEIVRLNVGDGGTLEDGQGFGAPLSLASVNNTLSHSVGHNEWTLTGGDVVGVFLNLEMGLYVAQMGSPPAGVPAHLAGPPMPEPVLVSPSRIAADFPGLSLFGFVGGVLTEIDPSGTPLAPCHPY